MDSLHQQLQSHFLTPENVAAVPPPGLSGPNQAIFAPQSSRYLAYVTTTWTASTQRQKPGQVSNSQAASPYLPLTDCQTVNNNSKNKKASNNSTNHSGTTSTATTERVIMCIDLESESKKPIPLLKWSGGNRGSSTGTSSNRTSSKRRMLESENNSVTLSLDERIRRERQRTSTTAGSLTQFSWTRRVQQQSSVQPMHVPGKNGTILSSNRDCITNEDDCNAPWRLLVPARGSLYVQDGLPFDSTSSEILPFPHCTCIHDKTLTGMSAIDAQLSPDGSMVAWSADGELYVKAISTDRSKSDDNSIDSQQPILHAPIRISFGASHTDEVSISHGVADFVAQEEMDRYRGFWWHPDSNSILFTRNDESQVPIYRIMHSHQDSDTSTGGSSFHINNSIHDLSFYNSSRSNASSMFEDHRYPFAGKTNPKVKLGLVHIHRESVRSAFGTNSHPLPPNQSTDESRGERDEGNSRYDDPMQVELSAQEIASEQWEKCKWFEPPREASEYLARVYWLPDGTAISQWQNRSQNCSLLYRLDLRSSTLHKHNMSPNGTSLGRILLVERSEIWINLHHLFKHIERPIHPDECLCSNASSIPYMPYPLPCGSFSFIYATERTGFQHLYLYTYCPGINDDQAVLLRAITAGEWMVEQIVGIDLKNDIVFFTGTYDSVLERHVYAVPLLAKREKTNVHRSFGDYSSLGNGNKVSGVEEALLKSANGSVRRGLSKVMSAFSGSMKPNLANHSKITLSSSAGTPVRLTSESGMHTIVMDEKCKFFVDTSSDLDRPTTVNVYELVHSISGHLSELSSSPEIIVKRIVALYDAATEDKSILALNVPNSKYIGSDLLIKSLPTPELITFPTTDGTETLHAAVFRPDPARYGPGPYPLVCAVYGGPHVQRVNRSWAQSADMRAQRLRSLGFCVVKCDNRGSSRRGIKFESVIAKRLGRLEVLDQVAAVRHLVLRGTVDPTRVGVYGWSYGGYLAAMCLCRAPDVFHVAVAGAPVTSWDGYDTHYTERYMGLPADNPAGYRESAVFEHIPNMRGKLMLVHGLIDENVHFRHSSRLISRLIAAGRDYDLLVLPEERHSPRRLRDRIYMEQRISDYFVKHLGSSMNSTALDLIANGSGLGPGLRPMPGHL